jgi:endogenous inhibitor of DNA gyrase (YacG/DUF329 family)
MPKDSKPAKTKVVKSKVVTSKIKPLHCPTCKTLVLATQEDFPFCSDRCRKIDLGKWAMGVYKISSPVLDPDLLEEIEGGQSRGYGSDHERDR